ncbi:alpha/beta hydrolase [Microbacterium sp. NPDC096154]|uniref:alpha/beta hydrolase n=1 Tax=Microbacterium sp. NPDC096154 TaxID=3155549 RepID=UPI00332BC334
MAQTFKERRSALAALGLDLTPDMVGGTIAIAAPDIDPAIYEGVKVVKDLAYGPHERNVLDVYKPADGGDGRPVLIYVHGGGFVRGAKDSDTTPYFRNIGAWAVQQGWVAVVINYRLAPEHAYPSGAQDVSAAVTWTVDRIAEHGGDPARIFLAGQSAGSMHVADYVVGHGGFGPHGRALAGAVIVSCIYDVGRASHKDLHTAYWGEDTSRWGEYATLRGLIDTDLPLMLAVSEYDEPEFQDHASQFVAEWFAQRGTYAPMHLLYGQNHLTPVYGVGSPWDELGPKLARFIDVNG